MNKNKDKCNKCLFNPKIKDYYKSSIWYENDFKPILCTVRKESEVRTHIKLITSYREGKFYCESEAWAKAKPLTKKQLKRYTL